MEVFDTVIKFLGAVAALISAIGVPLAWLAGKKAASEALAAKVAAVAAKNETEVVGRSIDGRMGELLDYAKKNSAMEATQIEKNAQAGREADAIGDALKQEKAIAAGVAAAERKRE